jgi:hypothetical protein
VKLFVQVSDKGLVVPGFDRGSYLACSAEDRSDPVLATDGEGVGDGSARFLDGVILGECLGEVEPGEGSPLYVG